MFTLSLGLEHLQTGVELVTDGASNITIEADGPTTFTAWSFQPFRCKWHVAGQETLVLRSIDNPAYRPTLPETSSMIRERVERNNRLQR